MSVRGNKNAVKGKLWERALRRALARSGGSVNDGLIPIAAKVVALASAGDLDAIREIACRLDGKPTEHVRLDQDVTVHAGDTDSISPRLNTALSKRQSPTVQ